MKTNDKMMRVTEFWRASEASFIYFHCFMSSPCPRPERNVTKHSKMLLIKRMLTSPPTTFSSDKSSTPCKSQTNISLNSETSETNMKLPVNIPR